MDKIVFLILTLLLSLSSNSWSADLQLLQNSAAFISGTQIELKYSEAGKLPDNSWVGIFPSGFQSSNQYVSFQYLKGEAGTLVFSAPKTPGAYEFVLYDASDESKPLAQVEFTVSRIEKSSVTLSIDKPAYAPAAGIEVKLTLKQPLSEKSWLGIFPAEIPHGATTGYLSYEYTGGNRQLSQNMVAPEKPGHYEFRLFDDNFGNEISYLPFEVSTLDSRDLSVKSDKDNYAPQEAIKARFVASSDFPDNAWIGLFRQEASASENDTSRYLDFRYLKKQSHGEETFMAPDVKGQYQLRMVSSEHGSVVAVSSFTVDRSLDSAYLKEHIEKAGKVALYGIYFDTDKSDIKPASEPTLQALGDLLKQTEDLSVTIEGHTDNIGPSDYNRQLSEKRAEAVMHYLVEYFAIDGKRLQAVGYGEDKPVADNGTESGRTLNRRTEIVNR